MRGTAWALAAAVTALTITTPAANAATKPRVDVTVGNLHAAAYWFPQSSGDCVEGAADVVYGLEYGNRLREATIVTESSKLLGYDVTTGTYFTDLPTILKHYGINSAVAPHSIKTIEAALAAGHKVIANVDAETIWNASPTFFAAYGIRLPDGPDDAGDHALTVDSIDETAGTVTLTDTGVVTGALETVPLKAFVNSYATSGYLVDITGSNS